jgi:hypothetical protein
MATTTPNYGWSVPTSTDLVKDGATAIETLGDSVDDSLWYSGYGQAGKNKIINGDFSINQRAFTSSTVTGLNFDRFFSVTQGGVNTYSAQTFTPGAAPVAGYESTNFLQIVTTGQSAASDLALQAQRIEDVRTFAGQTFTVSFFAKAASGTPGLSVEPFQAFGIGGSANVLMQGQKVILSTSWARYSLTFNAPSISGKTIGPNNVLTINMYVSAGSDRDARLDNLGNQNNTFQIWGVQVEAGDFATPFQTASGGSRQAELAMCQRYYFRALVDGAGDRLGVGNVNSTTQGILYTQFPVQMRVAPTALEQSGTAGDYSFATSGGTIACSAVPIFNTATTWNASTELTAASGLVAGHAFLGRAVNTNAFLGWSAEL